MKLKSRNIHHQNSIAPFNVSNNFIFTKLKPQMHTFIENECLTRYENLCAVIVAVMRQHRSKNDNSLLIFTF